MIECQVVCNEIFSRMLQVCYEPDYYGGCGMGEISAFMKNVHSWNVDSAAEIG